MAECEGEYRRGPLGFARLAEHCADAAQREQLERDRRRSVCPPERLAERPLRFADVVERQRGKADPAEGGDHPPPVVDLAERLVAGPTEPQRLLVVLHPVGAEARAAQRVAGAADVSDTGEQLVRLHVQAHRVAVALLGIGEEPELARGVRAQKRVAQLL